VIRGKHRIMVGKGKVGASMARSVMDEAFSEPLVFVGSHPPGSDPPSFRVNNFSGVKHDLPENVMLVTFLRRHSNIFLVRLGHQYGSQEDSDKSQTVEMDMTVLFKDYTIKSMVEMTLSANQKYDEWVDRRFDWTGSGPLPSSSSSSESTMVELRPMDIKTFLVNVVLHREDTAPSAPTASPHHHAPTHHTNSSPNTQVEKSPSLVPLVLVSAAALVAVVLYVRRRAQRYRQFQEVVEAAEMDFEVELAGYRPAIM
jgi:hypothetical protein